MRVLAVDPGTKRVGLAVSDPTGLIASPLVVIPRKNAEGEICRLVEEMGVDRVIVGVPAGLRGVETASGRMAKEFIASLRDTVNVTVEPVDERFTSRIADSALLEAGMSRKDRRAGTDKVAAAVMLQGYLDQMSRRLDPGQGQTEPRS